MKRLGANSIAWGRNREGRGLEAGEDSAHPMPQLSEDGKMRSNPLLIGRICDCMNREMHDDFSPNNSRP